MHVLFVCSQEQISKHIKSVDAIIYFQSTIHVSKEIQNSGSSGSDSHRVDTSTDSSAAIGEASSAQDQNEKEMTLGDALSENPVKDASLVSVEVLQNLAGGADIKVVILHHLFFLL